MRRFLIAVALLLMSTTAWADAFQDLSNVAIPAAPNNLTGNTTAHTYYAAAFGDCVLDLGACANAASAVVSAAGGGTVVLPAGVLAQSTTIAYLPKVSIEGAGWSEINTCGTKSVWNGAAGGVMVQAGDMAVDAAISGLGFNKVCLDGNGIAANGLKLIDAQKSQFSNFFLRNFTGCAVLMDATANTGPSGNLITNFQINQNFAGAGHGVCFGAGSPHGDVFSNQISNGVVVTMDGNGFDCKGSDTNTFTNVRFTTTGAGLSGIFYAGTARGGLDGWCRRNFFYATLWQGGGLQVQSGIRASSGNQIYGFKRGDGEILPDIQDYVLATTGTTHTSTTLDGLASVAGITVDMPVFGSGIPAAAYVVSIGASSVTLSAAATTSEAGIPVNFGGAADLVCLDTNQFSCGSTVRRLASYVPPILATTGAPVLLTANDCGTSISNRAASTSSTQTLTLPVASASGCSITFTRFPVVAGRITVKAQAGDLIGGVGRTGISSSGGSITNNSRYSGITLTDQGPGQWVVSSVIGGWTTDLGGIVADGGPVTLVTLVAASSPSFAFTSLPSGSTLHLECKGILPASDGVDALFQVSTDNGSNWKASNYSYVVSGYNTGGAATAATSTTGNGIQLNAGSAIDASASNPFTLLLDMTDNESTTLNKNVTFQATYNNNTPVFETVTGAGKYTGDQAAINAIRLIMSSGQITSGVCSLSATANVIAD